MFYFLWKKIAQIGNLRSLMSFANNYCQFKHQRCVININFLEQIFWSSWLIFLKATRSVSSRVKDFVICNDSALPLLYRLFWKWDLHRLWYGFEADLKRMRSGGETKTIRWKGTQHLRLDLPYKLRKIKFLYYTCLFFRKFMYLCTRQI